MTAISLLCDIIAQGYKTSVAFYRDDSRYSVLLRHGYLREAGVITSVVCNDCATPHAVSVIFEDGNYGYFCPDLGFIWLHRDDLKTVQPDLPRLIEALAEAFNCKRRKTSALQGETWRVGSIETDGQVATIYFHPRLRSERDARDLDQALAREVQSQWRLIVSANGTLPLANSKSVRLDELVEIDNESGAIRVLAQPSEVAGVPRKKAGGRPSIYGTTLDSIIFSRKESGAVLDGFNAEAQAIQSEFRLRHPGKSCPSVSTIKRQIKKAQGGS